MKLLSTLGRFDSEARATAAAEASDLRQQVVAILYLLTFIIAGATILRWIYRANQNARLLGAETILAVDRIQGIAPAEHRGLPA